MKVLVDTSIWSLALRRKTSSVNEDKIVSRLRELIDEHRAELIGPIRQELLSGVREKKQFDKLRDRLRAFEDLPLSTADFERAAEMANNCRASGIQGSHTDSLICAAAERHQLSIFTSDCDFLHYEKCLSIRLFLPPPKG